jgi:hypothetical protein
MIAHKKEKSERSFRSARISSLNSGLLDAGKDNQQRKQHE